MEGELILASSLAEALALKDAESIFFAGGTGIGYKDSGIRAKKMIVIPDIPGIREIALQEDGFVRIGALVTFTRALEDPAVPACLKEALRFCGSLPKRNMATVGGNLASRRDDSYLVPTLIAAGARICLEGRDGREVTGMEDFMGGKERYADSLVTALLVRPSVRVLSKRFANTVESHACLTLSMGRSGDEFRIGMAIKGSGIFQTDMRCWSTTWEEAGVADDMYGSEAYKRHIARVTLEAMYEELRKEGDGAP